jgi:hypothetical protein
MKFPTPEEMRDRFAELGKKRETILAKSGPLREARDKHSNDAAAKERQMNARILKAEEGLVDIATEMAMISRALGGKTAVPDEAAGG